MKRLFVFGIVFGIIPSVALGAATNLGDVGDTDFFMYITQQFTKVMTDAFSSVSDNIAKYYVNHIINAFLMLIIFLYAFRKIKEATFEFPKDAIEILIFITMVWFVNKCLTDYNFLTEVTSVLDIPKNAIIKALNQGTTNIGTILSSLLANIFNNFDYFVGEGLTFNIFKVKVHSIIKFIIWVFYAIFSFILIASIAMTSILTLIQIIFWKAFATLMIPLIYFKATRGMVIHWAKTIIALSLIGAFMLILAILSNNIEYQILLLSEGYSTESGISYSIIAAIIIAKIISITLLKELPSMINGMLGTSAAQGAGQFANSVAMGIIGAAGAGAGFAAFKGAMKGGKLAGKTALGGAKTIADATGATGAAKSITGNVKSKISNVANSRLGKGISNIVQGNSAFKDNPKN